MLINTDLSTDSALASSQNPRAGASSNGSQTSSASSDSAAAQLDPSLQRLTDLPAGVQDADWEIQDDKGAAQAVESARQGILGQPGKSMAAQANQLPQNVLILLQQIG